MKTSAQIIVCILLVAILGTCFGILRTLQKGNQFEARQVNAQIYLINCDDLQQPYEMVMDHFPTLQEQKDFCHQVAEPDMEEKTE